MISFQAATAAVGDLRLGWPPVAGVVIATGSCTVAAPQSPLARILGLGSAAPLVLAASAGVIISSLGPARATGEAMAVLALYASVAGSVLALVWSAEASDQAPSDRWVWSVLTVATCVVALAAREWLHAWWLALVTGVGVFWLIYVLARRVTRLRLARRVSSRGRHIAFVAALLAGALTAGGARSSEGMVSLARIDFGAVLGVTAYASLVAIRAALNERGLMTSRSRLRVDTTQLRRVDTDQLRPLLVLASAGVGVGAEAWLGPRWVTGLLAAMTLLLAACFGLEA
jgi:hypothetical protein